MRFIFLGALVVSLCATACIDEEEEVVAALPTCEEAIDSLDTAVTGQCEVNDDCFLALKNSTPDSVTCCDLLPLSSRDDLDEVRGLARSIRSIEGCDFLDFRGGQCDCQDHFPTQGVRCEANRCIVVSDCDESDFREIIGEAQTCQADSDCSIFENPACGGNFGCYRAINLDSEERFIEAAEQFLSGCDMGSVCESCGPAPGAICRAGLCSLGDNN